MTMPSSESATPAVISDRTKLVCLLAGLLIISRAPDAFLQPQFWAEDIVFFGQNWLLGPMSIFESYAGYLHLLPRLTAWLAGQFHATWNPVIFSTVALGVTLFIFVLLDSRLIRLPSAWALVLATTMVPHTGEVFLNITNIQWFCSLLLLGSVFVANVKINKPWNFVLYTFIGISALSSPTVFIVLPLCLLRLMLAQAVSRYPDLSNYCMDIDPPKTQRTHFIVISTIYCLACLLQLYYLTSSEFKTVDSVHNIFLGLSYWLTAYKVIAHRVLALYANNLRMIDLYTLAYSGFTLLTLFVAFFKRRYFFHQLCIALFVIGLSLLLAMKFKTGLLFLYLQDTADRYFYLPKVLFLWQWLLMVDRPVTKCLILLSAVTLLLLNSQLWTRPDRIDIDWQQHANRLELINVKQTIEIPINPPGWMGVFIEKAPQTQNHKRQKIIKPPGACQNLAFEQNTHSTDLYQREFYLVNNLCKIENEAKGSVPKITKLQRHINIRFF